MIFKAYKCVKWMKMLLETFLACSMLEVARKYGRRIEDFGEKLCVFLVVLGPKSEGERVVRVICLS